MYIDSAFFEHAMAPRAVTIQVTLNHCTGSTCFYDTEMTQLVISGGNLPAGTQIRESPVLNSTGQTTIQDLGSGGPFKIDSFFDIFTELSVDGDATWTPSNGANRILISDKHNSNSAP